MSNTDMMSPENDRYTPKLWRPLSLIVLLLALVVITISGCQQDADNDPTPGVAALPTSTSTPAGSPDQTADSSDEISFITIATDAPSRFKDFEDINAFGDVIGLDPDIMAYISGQTGVDYEFVVTSFDGLLNSVSNAEFDAAMSALIIPEQPDEGLVYSEPYLEIGQVMVVRANETVLLNHSEIEAGIPIGVHRFTSGEQIARGLIGLTEPDLQMYDSSAATVQALIDGQVEGIIIDNIDAEHFTSSYPQQLKITGGTGRDAWIAGKAYGIVVAEGNEPLLNLFNESISQARADGIIGQLIQTWLVSNEDVVAGESLVGTPVDELVIGVTGQMNNLDTAASPADFIGWEVKSNTMAGLLMIDEENNLVPILASSPPQISEDKLEYTFSLKPDLQFPNGNEFTAQDVKFSVERAAMLGNYLVNSYLKDENEDNFADVDAVQIIDPLTVKFILQEPASYFPSLLATPPYFVVDSVCYSTSQDPINNCGGLGKYSITEMEPGVQMRLEANPQWPGEAPKFGNIQLRFYEDPDGMRRSLENRAVDLAWIGLSQDDINDLSGQRGFIGWEGPSVFKSYLVFEQGTEPWDDARIRQAIALAVDREALAAEAFNGSRSPLFSPVPDGTPGHVPSEPDRDLAQAQVILTAAGYSADNKLVLELWYEDGGRYSDIEAEYAETLKAQLEETGLIQVDLSGAPYSVFRPQSASCNYPAYLLGWPSPGQPASHIDAMSWIEYFITNTDTVCSNYESEEMVELYEAALAESNVALRQEIYRQIQELWAQEYPTLDLTQESHTAISLPNVTGVVIDALGLLHFDQLEKSSG
ncbi:MAG TPA: ABC transporter substrate-binding protein [candidate division Zixibacteria bacterium]|nr:ABC transporter substrate-binding protein [candidate division Zixibacteria bacterium]